MTRRPTDKRGIFILAWAGIVIGATAGAITTLSSYVRREIRRRGYPSWDDCRCDFKSKQTIFQVWHSQHEQRGETIVAQEWGLRLSDPPYWLRRLLHHSAQIIATLNPSSNYVERVTLSPQEAYQLAILLRGTSSEEEIPQTNAQIVWRREVLQMPRHFFDGCIRRLYPAQIPQERLGGAQPLPALWDVHSNLPLPAEGNILKTPVGTRIDCIGWTPSQISYCTVRNEQSKEP